MATPTPESSWRLLALDLDVVERLYISTFITILWKLLRVEFVPGSLGTGARELLLLNREVRGSRSSFAKILKGKSNNIL
jgi:hypothetical protein